MSPTWLRSGDNGPVIDEADAASVAREIADGFGLDVPRLLSPVAQGAMGRVWRLHTDSGAFAVKESLWPEDPETFVAQLEFSTRVSEQAGAAGIQVPPPRRTEDGSLLLAVRGAPAGDPTQVRVATWIEGTPCHRELAGQVAAEWLGTTLAILERLPDPPTPPAQPSVGSWFSQVPGADVWHSLLQRGQRGHAMWAPALARQLTPLVELGGLVEPAGDDLTVTHTDLQPQNVLITDDGYAVLDWDDVASVSRARTLACAINNWHLHGDHVDIDGVRRTLSTYRAAGGTGKVREPTDFGDVITGFLNYLLGQLEISLDQPHGATEARAASGEASELLENPLNVDRVHRLLDIIRIR